MLFLFPLLLGLITPTPLTTVDHHLVVLKAARRLELYDGTKLIRQYRVGLGNTPVGDKVRSGDGKTPEGTFYVCVKNPQSNFYLSLGLSYPDSDDAARGLRDGLINQAEHDRIVLAQKQRATPPWDTVLGGEIFIHGHGSATDWTLGCVALDDPEMKQLYELIEVGTPVTIKP